MLHGQELYERLHRMDPETRENFFVTGYYDATSITDMLVNHESCFTKDEQDTLHRMPYKDKLAVLRAAITAYDFDVCKHGTDADGIDNYIEKSMHEYCKLHKKTHYTVTMSFLAHVTVECDALNADEAGRIALGMVDDGKVKVADFEKDDTIWGSVQVDEVYNAETEETEKNIFSADQPKQKKDYTEEAKKED